MDANKKYILMCEKAKEIQDLHTNKYLETGSYYITRPEMHIKGYVNMWYPYHEGCNECMINNSKCDLDRVIKYVWLPRQDQLQEMIDKDLYHKESSFNRFCVLEFYRQAQVFMDRPNIKFETMEQLWLAYVMEKNYNRVWNGKDWEGK